MPKLVSPYQRHISKWSNCDRCPLCETRKKVVLFRGTTIPCEVLFIGEAPGKVEDVLGEPFVGPAGQLLDRMITESGLGANHSLGFTNLISCIPLEVTGEKNSEPPKESIEACNERLVEIVRLCKPSMVILVGTHAQKAIKGQADFGDVDWLVDGNFLEFVHLIHPAAILRMDVSKKGLAIQRCVTALSDARITLENLVPF